MLDKQVWTKYEYSILYFLLNTNNTQNLKQKTKLFQCPLPETLPKIGKNIQNLKQYSSGGWNIAGSSLKLC